MPYAMPFVKDVTKSVLPETNYRLARKSWAEEYQYWVQEWSRILWSDEIWINDGSIVARNVIRQVNAIWDFQKKIHLNLLYWKKIKIGDDLQETCTVDRYKRNNY